MPRYSSYTYLTVIAVIFHLVGLAGIGYMHSDTILQATPLHLLLMFVLLLLSYKGQSHFIKWAVAVYIIGFAAEWIGVHTGSLFGVYQYGQVLGWKISEVPLLIGCNWVVVMTGAGSIAALVTKNKYAGIMLAATIATVYDWVLEPMATHLGYWQWADKVVPLYNYVCWWGLSCLLAALWAYFGIRPNKFGITLFIMQLVFFIILRILL